MKLSLRSAIVAALLSLSAQLVQSQYTPEALRPGDITNESSAPADIRQDENLLWSEDFDGELPEGWLNENENGFCAFAHTYQGPQGPFSVGMPSLNSVTAENGFMILDSDLCTSQNEEEGFTNAWLQSPAIDIPEEGNLMLNFTHNFRYCCSPDQTQIVAEVSINGTDWTSFDVRNGYAPNNTSSNPVYQAIDISELTQGETQVWIRFRKTGASHYWWMIDDVALTTFVENDLEIVETTTTGGYAQIPAGQQQPMLFESTVRNAGGEAQTNVQLTTTVNEYLFSSEILVPEIQPGQMLDFVAEESFIPPGRGVYEVKFAVEQDQEDMVPETNQSSFTFQVTDTIYSRTGDTAANGSVVVSTANEIFALANRYEIFENTELTSISVLLHPDTEPGAEMYAKVYRLTEGDYTEVGTSEMFIYEHETGNEEEPQLQRAVMSFVESIALEPGSYMAALFAPAQQYVVTVPTALNPFQLTNASMIWTEEQWVEFLEGTPFVDMHFGNNQAECDPYYHFEVSASLCGTSSGSIEVVPLSGFGPYTYEWTDFPEVNEPLLEELIAGEYEVTITDDYGCESTHTVEVTDEEIDVEYSMTPALCDAGGALELSPLNGTEPYSYVWAFDTTLEGPLAENLASGVYRVTVTDGNDCEVVLNLEVENIAELPVAVNSTDAFCGSESGTITLLPEGGEAPFTYQWNDFAENDDPVQENLAPGTYAFTVTDSNDCAFSGTASVENDVYELQTTLEKENASCGLNNGFVSIELLNGQEPFVFDWSTGHTEAQASELAPGTYQVEVSDDFGCAGTVAFEIENLGEMPEVTSETVNAEGCGQETGSISIAPANEENQYLYTLLTNDEDDNGDDNSGDDNGEGQDKDFTDDFQLENLAAGQYYVSVVNEEGCELIVALNVSDQGAPAILAEVEDVTCHGLEDGAIALTLEDATAPEYLWDDDLASTDPELNGLTAGTYTVWVADGECLAVESYTIEEPEMLLAEAAIEHIVCANEETGNIYLTPQGGTTPYTYIWSNGDSVRDLLDVPAGEYNVTVRDFHECLYDTTFTIKGNDPLEVSATINNSDDGQNNGSIILAVSGGVPDYTFSWSHGAQSSVLSDLPVGTYTVIITDAEGCTLEETFMVGTVSTNPIHLADNGMEIFPNPASQMLNVKITGREISGKSLKVEVMNILGAVVTEMQVTDYLAGNAVQLDLRGFEKGMYILRVSAEDQTWKARFIKK